MTEPTQWTSLGPAQTKAIARTMAQTLPTGSVIALVGELGAGKTCFVQGLAEALGVTEPVTSPTYTLIHEYPGNQPLIHVDLYRLHRANDVWELGLDMYWGQQGLVAIEWPQVAAELLPATTSWIVLEHGRGEDERFISYGKRPTP